MELLKGLEAGCLKDRYRSSLGGRNREILGSLNDGTWDICKDALCAVWESSFWTMIRVGAFGGLYLKNGMTGLWEDNALLVNLTYWQVFPFKLFLGVKMFGCSMSVSGMGCELGRRCRVFAALLVGLILRLCSQSPKAQLYTTLNN